MPPTVLLFSDRQAFADAWIPLLTQAGLQAQMSAPERMSTSISGTRVALIDAGADVFDEDELLASVGLARALGVVTAVGFPDGETFDGIDDVIEDLCPGLVARRDGDLPRVAGAISRRCDSTRRQRFEYLTVSPRADELLAILGDGTTTLLSRPASPEDDGSEVASIQLAEDAVSATLTLASGAQVTLSAANVSANHTKLNGNGTIDGAKLGARLRELRLAAGLTQAELARRTGIHRPNIARVEAGRHTPSLETLARLASAIGVPTTYVLSDK